MDTPRFRTSLDERRSAAIDFDALDIPYSYISVSSLPAVELAESRAEYIRDQFIKNAARIAIAEAIIDRQNWGLDYRDLSPGRTSTLRALLIPRLRDNNFVIVVGDNPRFDDDMAARLIGHEIAHTYFYGKSEAGRITRMPNLRHQKEEEEFCDQFSGALLD